MIEFYLSELPSPVGKIHLVTDGKVVRALDFGGYEERMHRLLARYYGAYSLRAGQANAEVAGRMADYFAGDLRALERIVWKTAGSVFQEKVWQALFAIAPGSTASYQEIATRIGQPKACRAVGLANGANPIALVIPCHRVIGASKSLTGYGGGLERKEWLLAHEGARVATSRLAFAASPNL